MIVQVLRSLNRAELGRIREIDDLVELSAHTRLLVSEYHSCGLKEPAWFRDSLILLRQEIRHRIRQEQEGRLRLLDQEIESLKPRSGKLAEAKRKRAELQASLEGKRG